jgi:hypothetical protein
VGGPLDGGVTLVGGADTLGGEPGFCRWASALAPAATSWQYAAMLSAPPAASAKAWNATASIRCPLSAP